MFVFSAKRPPTCSSQRVNVSLPDEAKLYLNVNSKNGNKHLFRTDVDALTLVFSFRFSAVVINYTTFTSAFPSGLT